MDEETKVTEEVATPEVATEVIEETPEVVVEG